jgi:hypothetical protein
MRQDGTLSDLDLYALNLLQDIFCAIRKLALLDLTEEGKQHLYALANDAHNIPEYVGNIHAQRSWPNITDGDIQQETYERELLRLYDAFGEITSGRLDDVLLERPKSTRVSILAKATWWIVGATVSGTIVGFLCAFFYL